MIGGGELEESIKEGISSNQLDNVEMLGAISREQVLEILPGFSAIVVTSQWEGLPYLPLEAMGRGVPVVSVNVGGISEIIEHNASGLLVNSRSPDELAEAVMRLDSEPGLRKTLIQNAKKRVSEEFSVDKMLEKLTKVYEQALG